MTIMHINFKYNCIIINNAYKSVYKAKKEHGK